MNLNIEIDMWSEITRLRAVVKRAAKSLEMGVGDDTDEERSEEAYRILSEEIGMWKEEKSETEVSRLEDVIAERNGEIIKLKKDVEEYKTIVMKVQNELKIVLESM